MLSTTTPIWPTLTGWDWFLFLLTIILTLLAVAYGLIVKKRLATHESNTAQEQTWSEYILMGRRLTLPFFVATLVASWYGNIIGITQIAFQYGIYSFVTQGVLWYISYILFALLLARYVRKMQILSFPALFTKLIGKGPGDFSAGLTFLKTLPITYAMGIGVFLKMLWGISFPWAVGIGLLWVLLYSSFGGFRSVVFSDFIQFFFMYLGIIAVVVVSFLQFGGISYLTSHCPPQHFSVYGSFSALDTLVWFFIAVSTTFLNPTFYQICLSATSDRVAVRGILISTCCWIVFDLSTTLIGLYAKAYFPEEAPLDASLQYCLQILPSGLKGLFLGAILSTILSTLNSFLFVSSTKLTYDLQLIRLKSKSLSHLIASCITGACTYCIAVFYEGNFEMAWRMIKGGFAACLFPPFIISYFKPHWVTSQLFTISCFCVLIGILAWNFYKPFPIDAFYVGQGIAWMVLTIGIICNYLTTKM